MKFLHKEKLVSGERNIYFCGKRIFHYFNKSSFPKKLNKKIIKITAENSERHEKCYLAIAAILKNEPDIIEWIEFHKLVGIRF